MLLCYITDRTQFPGPEILRRELLLRKIAEAASCGVDFIQLREKDLYPRDLERLACQALHVVRKAATATRLLINSRTDIALACGLHGVHLRSDDVSAHVVRRASTNAPTPVISVSCHSPEDVRQAVSMLADFAVFGPVFEKPGVTHAVLTGLHALRSASTLGIPVCAIGGVTLANAPSCREAGAAGVASIRLFQENSVAEVVRRLHNP